ncbi:MAG: ATP-binding protein [Pseudomonadota bacterium]
MSELDWQQSLAAVWRPNQGRLRPVKYIDQIALDDLLGIERQKQALIDNTRRYLSGDPCNNALLWGSRGTGKSSLIKAVFNHFSSEQLRLVEVYKDDLHYLHDIVDLIRDQPFHYLVYCDDLAFSAGDHSYSVLKTVLEGSIEAAPDNVRLYATSNRRHLVPQTLKENLDSKVVAGELHLSDAIEEKIALSDRFGLWLSFHPISQAQYLEIVDNLFADFKGDREELHRAALRFSAERASRSGRTAKQFHNAYATD